MLKIKDNSESGQLAPSTHRQDGLHTDEKGRAYHKNGTSGAGAAGVLGGGHLWDLPRTSVHRARLKIAEKGSVWPLGEPRILITERECYT